MRGSGKRSSREGPKPRRTRDGRHPGYPQGVYEEPPGIPPGVYFLPPFFISLGAFFSSLPPFFSALGARFFPARPFFSHAGPPVSDARRASRGYPRGVYFSAGGGIFMRLIRHFRVFFPIFKGFPRHAKNPGKKSRDHDGCRQRDALRAAWMALILSAAAALCSSVIWLTSLPLLYDTSFAGHSK